MKSLRLIGLAAIMLACSSPDKKTTAAKPDSDAAAKSEGKAEAQSNEPQTVTLSTTAQRSAGITSKEAAQGLIADILRLTGTVQPIDTRIAHVRPLARGRLTEILVLLGDRVRAGQVLARFDNIEAGDLASQYASARADLARLRVQQAQAERQATRTQRLTEIGALPQRDYELAQTELQSAAELIRAQESNVAGVAARLKRLGVEDLAAASASITAIRSPIAGIVTATEAAPNEVVEPSSELFTVADLSRVYVAGQVYEKDVAQVRVGQQARITVAPYPEQRFTGPIVSVGNSLDPETRTAAVRIEVPNPGERLKLAMFATIELPAASSRKGITVEATAVQRIDEQSIVFVRRSATEFEVRTVQVGSTMAGRSVILSGLRPGEAVVTQGAFRLKSVLQAGELSEEE